MVKRLMRDIGAGRARPVLPSVLRSSDPAPFGEQVGQRSRHRGHRLAHDRGLNAISESDRAPVGRARCDVGRWPPDVHAAPTCASVRASSQASFPTPSQLMPGTTGRSGFALSVPPESDARRTALRCVYVVPQTGPIELAAMRAQSLPIPDARPAGPGIVQTCPHCADQFIITLASDPFGSGRDIIGTRASADRHALRSMSAVRQMLAHGGTAGLLIEASALIGLVIGLVGAWLCGRIRGRASDEVSQTGEEGPRRDEHR
jgi:hypothetical protein